MRKFKILALVLFLFVLLTGCNKEDGKIHIGITQYVEHPSLDDIKTGVLDALHDKGYTDGDNIEIEIKNAQGNIETTSLIAKSFKDKDLVVAITTPSAQSAFNNLKDIPIIFSGVTDPDSAGLIGDNITGVSDMTPIKEQFELMMDLLPDTKTVGMIYNSGELNSEIQVEISKSVAKELGIDLEVIAVTTVSEIEPALNQLLDKVDVLYTQVDNLIASSYPLISKKALDNQVPIIGAVEDFVKQGALATKGINNYKVGYQTGNMVVRILEGERVADNPYETLKEVELILNEDMLKTYNIHVKEDIEKESN